MSVWNCRWMGTFRWQEISVLWNWLKKSYMYFKALSQAFFDQMYGLLHKALAEIFPKAIVRGVGGRHIKQDPMLWCTMGWCSAGKVFAWLLSSSEFLSQRFHETQKYFFKVPAPNIFQLRWKSWRGTCLEKGGGGFKHVVISYINNVWVSR